MFVCPQGFVGLTHEGLTTLVHPNRGWTKSSGTWNTLRETWGLTLETLQKIHDSCIIQSQLEKIHILTSTRHTFQVIKRTWNIERIRTSSGMNTHLLLLGLEEQGNLVEVGNGGDNRYGRLDVTDVRTEQG